MRCVLSSIALILGLSGQAQAQAQTYNFRPVNALINSFVGTGPRDLLTGASLVVIQNGQTIYQQSYGDYVGTQPKVSIASASKWLSAFVLERLVESGKMHWTDTVADYYGSDYPGATAQKGSITLGQLFSHTSGISVPPATCLGVQYKNIALDACAKSILGQALSWAPGTYFAYGENSMQVAGAMAERATGLSWDQLVQTELTGPLSMTRTNFGTNNNGTAFLNPIIAGGARSTSKDYANVVQMVLQKGMFNGTQYLSPESIAEMQEDQTHGVPIDPDADPYPDSYGYGYGEWRDKIDCATGVTVEVSSTGVFATSPWVDYDNGIAAVFLAYQQDADPSLRDKLSQVWNAVSGVVGSVPPDCSTAHRSNTGHTPRSVSSGQ
jgi:CubicO group peptidase (beta-lactamase class C family)